MLFKTNPSITVFIIALAIRVYFVFFTFDDYITSDGNDYHNIAVNIVTNGCYSRDIQSPITVYFFREPVYPLFLASVYAIYNVFDPPTYVTEGDIQSHPEIKLAKFAQAVLGAITCLLFYQLMLLVLSQRASFIIAVLYGLYIPAALYTTLFSRETLQSFLLICMSYCYAQFYFTKRWKWLVGLAISWAASNMTLQITALAIFVMIIFMLVNHIPVKQILIKSFFIIIIMITCISPWLFRTYSFYPNWKIIKSFGTSLTYESAAYAQAIHILFRRNVLSTDESNKLLREWYNLSEYEKFDFSFNGHFETERKKLNATYSVPFEEMFKDYLLNFRTGWIESLWYDQSDEGRISLRPHSRYLREKKTALFVISLIPFVFGYLAFLGIFMFGRKTFPILLMFCYFLPLLPLISNEPRRALPIHPFIIMFSCLAVYFLYLKFFKKLSSSQIIDKVILGKKTV